MYEMDLGRISLDAYRSHLISQQLMPSRKRLHDDIDARFDALIGEGIDSVGALRKSLSTKTKIEAVSKETNIPYDYLNILRREAGSLVPKRIKLSDFPNVSTDTIKKLADIGIHNSKDYFDNMSPDKAEKLGIGEAEYLDIRALCDIARISGMGGIASRIFVDAGYKSVEDIEHGDAATMHRDTCTVNATKAYYSGVLSARDMQFVINYAQMMRRLSQ